jgi:uncharacterized protein (UPF0332 family)
MKDFERKELVIYRLHRAKETLDEVQSHLTNGYYNTSVNRLYYACYYAVTALLINSKINTNTHSGVRQMFGLHFIKTEIINKDLGRFFSDIYDKRQAGDYDDFIFYNEDNVKDLMIPASTLISEIESLLK